MVISAPDIGLACGCTAGSQGEAAPNPLDPEFMARNSAYVAAMPNWAKGSPVNKRGQEEAAKPRADGPVKWGKRDDGSMWLSIGNPASGSHVQADWEFGEGYAGLFAKAVSGHDPSPVSPHRLYEIAATLSGVGMHTQAGNIKELARWLERGRV